MDSGFLNLARMNSATAATAQVEAAARASKNQKEAREIAETFESVFLAQMLAPMFETVPDDDVFGGGHAEKIFRGMQVDEFAKEISRGGGIGIADNIYAEILKMQEMDAK